MREEVEKAVEAAKAQVLAHITRVDGHVLAGACTSGCALYMYCATHQMPSGPNSLTEQTLAGLPSMHGATASPQISRAAFSARNSQCNSETDHQQQLGEDLVSQKKDPGSVCDPDTGDDNFLSPSVSPASCGGRGLTFLALEDQQLVFPEDSDDDAFSGEGHGSLTLSRRRSRLPLRELQLQNVKAPPPAFDLTQKQVTGRQPPVMSRKNVGRVTKARYVR